MNNNFPWSICDGRDGRLHEGFSVSGRKPVTMAQGRLTGSTLAQLPNIFPKYSRAWALFCLGTLTELGRVT